MSSPATDDKDRLQPQGYKDQWRNPSLDTAVMNVVQKTLVISLLGGRRAISSMFHNALCLFRFNAFPLCVVQAFLFIDTQQFNCTYDRAH